MADLEQLLSQLSPEEDVGTDFDWANAPEQTGGGSYPPDVYPGVYEFLFKLPEDSDKQFAVKVAQGKNVLEVSFNCDIVGDENGTPLPEREDGRTRKAMFQRATNGLFGKMKISFMQDLVRCLGLADEVVAATGGKFTPAAAINALKGADGRATGRANFGWRVYFKSPDGDKAKGVTFSTSPRKKERKWPTGPDGKFIESIPSPFDPTELAMGRLEIMGYKLPVKG